MSYVWILQELYSDCLWGLYIGTFSEFNRDYVGDNAPVMENQMERTWNMKWKLGRYGITKH